MLYNIIRSVIWGFKNIDEIINRLNEFRNCNECNKLEYDHLCENHKQSYNKLAKNGPYGRTIRDIISE